MRKKQLGRAKFLKYTLLHWFANAAEYVLSIVEKVLEKTDWIMHSMIYGFQWVIYDLQNKVEGLHELAHKMLGR